MEGLQTGQGLDHPGALGPGVPQPSPAGPPSSAPKVFGVLSIVFSSLILLASLPMTCGGFAGRSLSNLGEFAPRHGDLPPELFQKVMETVGTIYTTFGVMAWSCWPCRAGCWASASAR